MFTSCVWVKIWSCLHHYAFLNIESYYFGYMLTVKVHWIRRHNVKLGMDIDTPINLFEIGQLKDVITGI